MSEEEEWEEEWIFAQPDEVTNWRINRVGGNKHSILFEIINKHGDTIKFVQEPELSISMALAIIEESNAILRG